MKVLVLHGSARKNGNTDILADEFIRGCETSGNTAMKIELKDLQLKDCLGCRACQAYGGNCIQKDDMHIIYEEMENADVIVFATPVYFYTWSAMIKRVLDRSFALEKTLQNKKYYLISCGAGPDESYMETLLTSFKQYVMCFRAGGNSIGGYIFGTKTSNAGDVWNSDAMRKSYEMGKAILK